MASPTVYLRNGPNPENLVKTLNFYDLDKEFAEKLEGVFRKHSPGAMAYEFKYGLYEKDGEYHGHFVFLAPEDMPAILSEIRWNQCPNAGLEDDWQKDFRILTKWW